MKMEPMSEHSAWPCGTAGEWSVLTSHRRRSGQPGIMEHLQVVVGYDRVLTPALSRIETSRNRAWQRQRPNWRACLPTASAILEDLSDPAFCMPDRKSMKPLKKSTVRVVAGLMTIPQVCLRRQGDALDRIYGRARADGRTGRRARISGGGEGVNADTADTVLPHVPDNTILYWSVLLCHDTMHTTPARMEDHARTAWSI